MPGRPTPSRGPLHCERLEARDVPASTATLAGGVLTVTGTAGADRLHITEVAGTIAVDDGSTHVGDFAAAAVTALVVDAGAGNDAVTVGPTVAAPATLRGGDGNDRLSAGGGPATLDGGPGDDLLRGGLASTAFVGGPGRNEFVRVRPTDIAVPGPQDRLLLDTPDPATGPAPTLSADDVTALLRRAAAASASSDGIFVVVDRGGRILGVRVESGVATELTSDPALLAFAVDGAVSLARTGAYFANDQAPLTSRTIRSLSQSTITEREVNSNPNVTDPNSTVRGPGFVAPVGIAGHFPPGIANTPQVDLFQIEHTNRDATFAPGPDGVRGTADDVALARRFNADPAFVTPGQELVPPDGYGATSGTGGVTANGRPVSQGRGIATLPGGVPIFKGGQLVGGLGVFFPGKTGYATEENSPLGTTYDPSKPDRTLEAEWVAFAAAGGTQSAIGGVPTTPIGDLGGVPLPAGIGSPAGRIDLVGITLDVFGPGGTDRGRDALIAESRAVGRGSPDDGTNLRVTPTNITILAGLAVPDGWLVRPHSGDGVTQAEVERIIARGLEQAAKTRAAIRLPLGSRAKFVYAVADRRGNVVGLYREPDATVFSIDVAVAKARNVAYYADAAALQPIDRVAGVPAGTALTNRTFRYLGLPRFPESVEGSSPGPFSQLNDGGVDPGTGRQVGPPLPASAYQSVVGYDAFHPSTNFRDPADQLNQDGIVFFPGSAPLYRGALLVGGFGVSGDGVDQDDVTTIGGQSGFEPAGVLKADEVFVGGVRLPYQKFNRNPEG